MESKTSKEIHPTLPNQAEKTKSMNNLEKLSRLFGVRVGLRRCVVVVVGIVGIFSFISCTCHLPSVYKAYFVFVSSVSQRLQHVFEFYNENIAVKN